MKLSQQHHAPLQAQPVRTLCVVIDTWRVEDIRAYVESKKLQINNI